MGYFYNWLDKTPRLLPPAVARTTSQHIPRCSASGNVPAVIQTSCVIIGLFFFFFWNVKNYKKHKIYKNGAKQWEQNANWIVDVAISYSSSDWLLNKGSEWLLSQSKNCLENLSRYCSSENLEIGIINSHAFLWKDYFWKDIFTALSV